jgi:hypothetical protein
MAVVAVGGGGGGGEGGESCWRGIGMGSVIPVSHDVYQDALDR